METLVEQGPLIEASMLTACVDYYKPTMSQLAHEKERDAEATFTFTNRGEQRLLDYIDRNELQARFDYVQETGFSDDELMNLAQILNKAGERVFSNAYLGYLQEATLPSVWVSYDEEADDLAIESTGDFPLVTFWETIVMSEVNEAYFEGYVRGRGIDLLEVYEEGDRRLSEKIRILQETPDIKFADFGTRRHFSLRWHKHVIERLAAECPDNLLGVSSVGLANTTGQKPAGTIAHEMYMAYAGLADGRGEDIRASQNKFLADWYELYGEEYATALTDTYGSEAFFEDFTPELAKKWQKLRQDSGDPFVFAERALEFYEGVTIDPATKTIVFSDGLDIEQIVLLHETFKDKINVIFGWGTTLTNDLGIEPLNIVMKLTEVNGKKTVKLSDSEGKHTGPGTFIKRYEAIFGVIKKEILA